MANNTLQRWHDFANDPQPEILAEILDKEAVFYSPVVHTPQQGKALVSAYLNAAAAVFMQGPFRYCGQWQSANGAVLEFETEIDGITVNGVDILQWNEQGLITHFKVMLRPLKAVNLIHKLMQDMLAAQA